VKVIVLQLQTHEPVGGVMPLEVGEAAQLGLHLAVFGRDEEMPRSRSLAEKLATAIELADTPDGEPLRLSLSQQAVVGAALDAMADTRGGDLSPGLKRLRGMLAQTGT
jgi:hypothetical protein